MDLKLLCYLVHCWHRILMLFHFGEDVAFSQSELLLELLCVTRKYFTLGGCCRFSALTGLLVNWIDFPFGVDVPQVCLHHCELRLHWSWYQSLSLRVFLFGRVLRSGKLQYFLQYFRLLYCFISLREGVSCWE